jgi:hypothetical protein
MWVEGSVGHEWEADQRPRYGSMLGVCNATSHLLLVNSGPGVGSLKWIPFNMPNLPCQALPRLA